MNESTIHSNMSEMLDRTHMTEEGQGEATPPGPQAASNWSRSFQNPVGNIYYPPTGKLQIITISFLVKMKFEKIYILVLSNPLLIIMIIDLNKINELMINSSPWMLVPFFNSKYENW